MYLCFTISYALVKGVNLFLLLNYRQRVGKTFFFALVRQPLDKKEN